MYNSIQHFIDVGVVKINKIKEGIYNGKMDASDLSLCIYEEMDDAIRESVVRKKYWNIEHRNQKKTITDVMGDVEYRRTGYCVD